MEKIDLSKLKNTIRGAGLNACDVCRQAGISLNTITQVSNGKRGLTVELYNKIVDAYKELKGNDR